MKQIIIILIITFGFIINSLNAQFLTENNEQDKPDWKKNVFFGGNFGLALGSTTYIEFAPNIGYRLTDNFDVGIGINYIYYRERIQYQLSNGNWDEWEYKSKTYGGKVFTDYTIYHQSSDNSILNISSLLAHAELEQLNVNAYNYDIFGNITDNGRTWITSVLVGAGLRQEMGSHSSVTLYILYNLTEEVFTPYSNPVIRVGFIF